MNVIDHTKTRVRNALAAARRLLLRFYDSDSHAPLAILAEVRHLAIILSRAPDPRALRRTEGRIYTAMQTSRAGRTRISRKSTVFLAEDLFQQMKLVMKAMIELPLARTVCRSKLERLLERTGDLVLLLEQQMTSVSASGMYRRASAFAALADELGEDISKCRIAVLAEPSETGHHNELALLQAIADLVNSAGRMAYAALRRSLGRSGKGRSRK